MTRINCETVVATAEQMGLNIKVQSTPLGDFEVFVGRHWFTSMSQALSTLTTEFLKSSRKSGKKSRK